MKKKIVGEELKIDIGEYINDPNSVQNRKLLHLEELNKMKQEHCITHLIILLIVQKKTSRAVRG